MRKIAGPGLRDACLALPEIKPVIHENEEPRDISRWAETAKKRGLSRTLRCAPGSAVATRAYGLDADWCIHAVAPDSEFGYEGHYQGNIGIRGEDVRATSPPVARLHATYVNAFKVCATKDAIALPALRRRRGAAAIAAAVSLGPCPSSTTRRTSTTWPSCSGRMPRWWRSRAPSRRSSAKARTTLGPRAGPPRRLRARVGRAGARAARAAAERATRDHQPERRGGGGVVVPQQRGSCQGTSLFVLPLTFSHAPNSDLEPVGPEMKKAARVARTRPGDERAVVRIVELELLSELACPGASGTPPTARSGQKIPPWSHVAVVEAEDLERVDGEAFRVEHDVGDGEVLERRRERPERRVTIAGGASNESHTVEHLERLELGAGTEGGGRPAVLSAPSTRGSGSPPGPRCGKRRWKVANCGAPSIQTCW